MSKEVTETKPCLRCGKRIVYSFQEILKVGVLCDLCEKEWKKHKKKVWSRFLDEGSTHSDITVDMSMPESFDDLVKIHGKDVIRDWLKAMLE